MIWETPVAVPILSEEVVHVWLVPIDQDVLTLEKMRRTLSPEERARAGRLRSIDAVRRFVAAHGALRTVIGGYLGLPPQVLRFCTNRYGKPALALDDLVEDLRFNLSHSGEVAMVAVGTRREVGVDVERLRERAECEKIAARFFAPDESAALLQLTPSERLPAFVRCWCRKEACLKAAGKGLYAPLDKFSVFSLDEELVDQPVPALCQIDGHEWTVTDLPTWPGYAAALSAAGDKWLPRCLRWVPSIFY